MTVLRRVRLVEDIDIEPIARAVAKALVELPGEIAAARSSSFRTS